MTAVTAGLDPALMADLERETAELLSRLIQIDTSNPPGNETAVATFMADVVSRVRAATARSSASRGRASFVCRLEGKRPGPTLLLLAHEDVVPANAADWRVPPFSGLVEDGYVWGRGALDIKNLVAANAVAVRRLAAAGAPFAGTVTYACTADEERCMGGGVRWLLEHRPELLRCDYVLNEGDGAYVPCGDRRLFLLQSGEKGAAQFRIVVHGRAGHGSVPLRQGNAVLGRGARRRGAGRPRAAGRGRRSVARPRRAPGRRPGPARAPARSRAGARRPRRAGRPRARRWPP